MSALAFMAGLAKGGLDGYMLTQGNERQKKEDEWRDEQRAYIREQRDNERALKTSMVDAVKPRTAQSAEVYSPAVDDDGNAMPANPTAGTYKIDDQFSPTGQRLNTFTTMSGATAAADTANTPQAQGARMQDVLMAAGQPEKAMSIRSSLRQNEVADLQAKQLKETDELNTKLREVGGLIARGGWGSVPEVYARYNDGFDAQVIEDGKGGATVVTMKDGKEVERDVFADLPQLYAQVAGQFKPELWMADVKDRATAAAAGRKERRDEDRLDLDRRRVEATERKTDAWMSSLAGKGKEAAPVWDDKADAFLRQRYTVTDPTTGQVGVDGGGLAFAKQIAFARAQQNGGDATSALGYAFQLDKKIQDEAGGDAAKIADGRKELLAKLYGTAAPAQAPASAPAAAPTAQARPAAAPPPPVDPMSLMNDRDLARLAAIPGHVNQQRAAALLEERKRVAAANNAEAAAGQGVNFPY